ncbi:MAG: TrkH family potassium uptake protein [Spirochaetales bacterium]|nr:TrkH family potassium uptake protein [Spirochaetales bacterium]
MAAFDSKAIQAIITIFMVLAGINFAIYFKLLTGRFKDIYRNTEFKYYLLFLVIITILITMNLTKQETYSNIGESLQYSSFQVASIMTTTGFASANYELWPHFSQGLIFLLMFIGGSAGSTGGGIKVVRIITLFKLAVYEMKKIIYPKSVFTIKMNKQPVEAEYLHNVGGFFFLYIICLIVTTMVVAAGGYNITSSFTTALATVGNIGPGFGDVGPVCNYSHFGAPVKWFLSFAMMVGRLEIYTVLVVLLPRFWKR